MIKKNECKVTLLLTRIAYISFFRLWLTVVCACGVLVLSLTGKALAEEWHWKVNVPVDVSEMQKEVKYIKITVRLRHLKLPKHFIRISRIQYENKI